MARLTGQCDWEEDVEELAGSSKHYWEWCRNSNIFSNSSYFCRFHQTQRVAWRICLIWTIKIKQIFMDANPPFGSTSLSNAKEMLLPLIMKWNPSETACIWRPSFHSTEVVSWRLINKTLLWRRVCDKRENATTKLATCTFFTSPPSGEARATSATAAPSAQMCALVRICVYTREFCS